jgi:hypothetical protein
MLLHATIKVSLIGSVTCSCKVIGDPPELAIASSFAAFLLVFVFV